MNLDLALHSFRGFLYVAVLFHWFQSLGQDYKPGRYYTQRNERVDGLLKYGVYRTKRDEASNWIFFKKDKDSENEKITVKEAKSFVIGSDSFAIIRGFFGGNKYFPEDFAKVIKKGKINLYLHYSDVLTVAVGLPHGIPIPTPREKVVKTYVVGVTGKYSVSIINPDNFRNQMESLFFDDDGMLQKFKKGKYKFKQLGELIDEYNLRWKNKNSK